MTQLDTYFGQTIINKFSYMEYFMSRFAVAAIGLAAASLFAVAPANAQKSKDEMRVVINDMFPVLDPIVFPQDEAGTFHHAVYQSLIAYEEREKKYMPLLAKSWKIVQPGVYEFDLRDDVTFHSGNKFNADDVVYTMNYFADPKLKIRFKARYDWVKSVEKLGDYKVRVTSKEPLASDLFMLAYRTRVYDSKVMSAMENPNDYGRTSASATGPYKMVSIDKQKIVLEKFKDSKDKYDRQAVNRYIGYGIPDEQTQIAQMMTGNLDAIRNISSDNASGIAQNPNMKMVEVPGGDIVYVTLDAAGRSKNKVMMDQRVRKAVMMAINRDELIKHIVPGHGTAIKVKAICLDTTYDCNYTTQPPEFDPAAAKKLLAEAGYPNGFDLQVDVHDPIRDIGEAIAGELRKVGIRTSVQPMPLNVYVKRRGEGEFTMFAGFYPTSSQPDTMNMFDFYFGQDRDYYKDDLILKAQQEANLEFNDEKRRAIYRDAIDRVNQMNYILPFSSLPAAYAMTKEVKIVQNSYSATAVYINDLVWNDYSGK